MSPSVATAANQVHCVRSSGMFANIPLQVIHGNISWETRKLFPVGSRTVSVL